jgi:hypothetical protein
MSHQKAMQPKVLVKSLGERQENKKGGGESKLYNSNSERLKQQNKTV